SNHFSNLLSIPDKKVGGVILNDDESNITIVKKDGIEGSESVDFTFQLEPGKTADKDITIYYSLGGTAEAGKDYTGTITGSVVISAGSNSQTLSLATLVDNLIEGDETIILTVAKDGVSSAYDIQI